MIHQEFGEIPSDVIGSIRGREGLFQKAKDFTSLGTIHVSLLEPSELIAASILIHKIENLLVGTWLLAAELIARKGKNLETPGS